MPKFSATGILIIMVVTLFNNGESIHCYVCRTDYHSGCEGDKLDPKYVKECPRRAGYVTKGYCRKINQQLYFKGDEHVTIIRECAYEKHDKPCYRSKWVQTSYQETCECDTDKCNQSSKPLPVNLLHLIVIILLWLTHIVR